MRHIIILPFLALTFPVLADSDIDESLAVKADGEVSIHVISGDVTIKAWNKSEVRVEGEIDGDEESLIFKTSGNETIIEVEPGGSGWGRHSHGDIAELTVFVPARSSVESEGKSTDFRITGVQGPVRLSSLSGDLNAEGLNNTIDLVTVSGDIVIQGSQGKINLESVSGDVEAKVEAIEFNARSISGDVDASIGKSERIRLASVSGDIDLKLNLAAKGRLEAETVSGDVDIIFANKVVNARFDLETGPGGEIDNKITDDRADESFLGSGSINFKSGDGSGVVKIDTMSGTIEVSD